MDLRYGIVSSGMGRQRKCFPLRARMSVVEAVVVLSRKRTEDAAHPPPASAQLLAKLVVPSSSGAHVLDQVVTCP